MASFNTLALGERFEIIRLIRSTNLQWTRKYHESGIFSIQIPLAQYSADMKYIYTKDRPELGRIEQTNYVSKNGYKYVQLSGYFLERDLNWMVVYPKGTTNITGGPAWESFSGVAEDVAFAYFNAFKSIQYNSYSVNLGIETGTSKRRGHRSIHNRNGEYLDEKIYEILKPSGMSYRVMYDFESSFKRFDVWQGLDRTEDQTVNNPIIFSTAYGNIKNPNILINRVSYRNACIVRNEYSGSVYVRAVSTQPPERFHYMESGINKEDYASDPDYWNAMDGEGQNALSDYREIINVEFDAMEGSYTYLKDFDIGDLCSIEISEMNLSADARLIGCYEVIKSGKWTLTMEFGTPLLR